MPEVLSVGGLLIPTLRASLLLALLLAPWSVASPAGVPWKPIGSPK